MGYISERIGDEYQNWKSRYEIFISAPTGSGKTHFILNVLLQYACQHGKRILYLVNRRILKEQMESEISNFPSEQTMAIQIELYQTLENIMSSLRYDPNQCMNSALGDAGLRNLEAYDYVVCDECHYFLADSNFNTNTYLSFRWIQDKFSDKIRIFISATIKDIKDYIMADDEMRRYRRTYFFGFHTDLAETGRVAKQSYYGKEVKKEYEVSTDYDYLLINIINSTNEISSLVLDGDKWLIFVDNISWGKELQKELQDKLRDEMLKEQQKAIQNKIKKELPEERQEEIVEELTDEFRNYLDTEVKKNVVMLASDYWKNEESEQEVDNIRRSNKQSAKILISTSVMDNGINLKDISLRNIVLIADTEVEFIQMLGRKRRDSKQVKLYVFKQDKKHFSDRLHEIQRIKKIAEEYWTNAQKFVKPLVDGGDIYMNWDFINDMEQRFIISQQKEIMNDIFSRKKYFEDVREVFYIFDGLLLLNQLSFTQIDNLVQYYNKIMEKFELEDDDAFVKEQLRWLGKTDTEIDRIISESKISREKKCRENITSEINKISGKDMEREEALEFYNKVREDLLVLVHDVADDVDKKQKIIRDLGKKNEFRLTKSMVEFLQKYCNIPIQVKRTTKTTDQGKKSVYTYSFIK